LGSTANTDNSIEEEIKERIVAGNRAYNVHKKLFTSKLISRNFKLQLYNTFILAQQQLTLLKHRYFRKI